MSAKFFGQYLLERGRIDRRQLLAGLEFQRAVNRSLGELAVGRGLLTHDQVQRIHAQQRREDRLFGEIAIALGYLDNDQVRALVGIQRNCYVYLGEALVEKGFIPATELPDLVHSFRQENQTAQPLAVQWEDLAVGNTEAAATVLEQIEKLLGRLLGWPSKLGAVRRGGQLGAQPPLANLVLTGDLEWGLYLGFAPGDRLRSLFTSAFMKIESEDSALIADAAGELLNIAAGNAAAEVRDLGLAIDISPPRTLDHDPGGESLVTIPLHCPEGVLLVGINVRL